MAEEEFPLPGEACKHRPLQPMLEVGRGYMGENSGSSYLNFCYLFARDNFLELASDGFYLRQFGQLSPRWRSSLYLSFNLIYSIKVASGQGGEFVRMLFSYSGTRDLEGDGELHPFPLTTFSQPS